MSMDVGLLKNANEFFFSPFRLPFRIPPHQMRTTNCSVSEVEHHKSAVSIFCCAKVEAKVHPRLISCWRDYYLFMAQTTNWLLVIQVNLSISTVPLGHGVFYKASELDYGRAQPTWLAFPSDLIYRRSWLLSWLLSGYTYCFLLSAEFGAVLEGFYLATILVFISLCHFGHTHN